MKYLKRTFDLVFAVYILFLCAITIPGLLGLQTFSVISQSMTPTISVGSAVYVQDEKFDEIQVGDIITFLFGKNHTTVTHRVIEKNAADKTFVTRGDANEQSDGSRIAYDDVLGVVRFCVPYLGHITGIIGETGGKLLLTGILLWLLLIKGILANYMETKRKEMME